MSKYPVELIEELRSVWLTSDFTNNRPLPQLPSDERLRQFLDVAFHASLQSEEQRRIRFRLMYCTYEQFDKCKSRSTELEWIPVLLEEPLLFTKEQIVRLTPATNFATTLIGVGESNEGLHIWGLIHTKSSWWKHRRGVATWIADPMPTAPPPFLTVSSPSPGQLSISCSIYDYLTLSDGEIRRSSHDPIFEGQSPLADFFKEERRNLYLEILEKSHVYSDIPIRDTFGQFLRNLLAKVQDKNHGGSLIFVRNSLTREDKSLTKYLKIKYKVQFDNVWELLTKLFIEDAQTAISQLGIVSRLDDAADFIATLTGVDGAVLITDTYRVLGFGVEVVNAPLIGQVRCLTGRYEDIKPSESFGTRHRSAFRFCNAFPDSVVFIISQDGGVKGTTNVNGDVVVWNDLLNLGYYGGAPITANSIRSS